MKPIKTHPEEAQHFEALQPCSKDINYHRRIGKVKEHSSLLPALKAEQHRNDVNQYSEVAGFYITHSFNLKTPVSDISSLHKSKTALLMYRNSFFGEEMFS